MKYGVVFPQTEIGNDPAAIRDYAQAAQDMGYHYLLAYDHVLGANPQREGGWQGPYTSQHSFYEPFVLFSYLAGLTTQLEFASGIIILPQRPAALVAKQAATLDVLCGGRLRVGIGVGWNQIEMQGLGYDFDNRGQRAEEQVQLLRELWTKPLVKFDGAFHTIDDAGLNPLPVQRPIPIWFGGQADTVLRRMARLGDGWMMNRASLEQGRVMLDKLHGYLREQGRKPEDFGLDIRINMPQDPPATWGELVEGWRRLGATHIGINTMGIGLKNAQEHIKAVQQFKQEIGF